ncbi:MAG: hypothetical protein ABFS56_21310 [Pseudomonadota bacterium]
MTLFFSKMFECKAIVHSRAQVGVQAIPVSIEVHYNLAIRWQSHLGQYRD